jgi:hypothetical protein
MLPVQPLSDIVARPCEVVESTFVWILETVCREMDAMEEETETSPPEEETSQSQGEGTRSGGHGRRSGGHGGKFTILLDLSTCPHVHLAAFFSIGKLLQKTIKTGFRGRLNRFYVYPTGKLARVGFNCIKPVLGKYTLPKAGTNQPRSPRHPP